MRLPQCLAKASTLVVPLSVVAVLAICFAYMVYTSADNRERFGATALPAKAVSAREYACRVVRCLDGDTIEVLVELATDLDVEILLNQQIRVYGLNCGETRTTNLAEKAAGLADKSHAESLLPAGSRILARTATADPREKYGRWLASVTLPDGRDFAATMIADKHGVAYFGGPRATESPAIGQPPEESP